MCLLHLSAVRGDYADKPLWSTSELIVSDCELLFTPGLQLRARNHHGYKRGMADASTSRVRAPKVFLRLSGRE